MGNEQRVTNEPKDKEPNFEMWLNFLAKFAN